MEKTRLIQKAALLLPAVREKRPLIHCITNYVAANDSANLLLAVGASPIMADCASEASEIAGKSAGVLLNLGIPNPDKLRAMRLAGETANLLHRPIVLDPVGAGASAYRREAIRGLLNRVQGADYPCKRGRDPDAGRRRERIGRRGRRGNGSSY